MVAEKNYRVSSFVSGLFGKAPVQVATTANITLSGEQTVNTVALLVGDRCLVKDQTDPIENGIYTVEQAAWQRAGDFDGSRDVVLGTMVTVTLPTGSYELYAVTAIGTIDVDAITFEQFLIGNATQPTLQEVTDEGATSTNEIELPQIVLNQAVAAGADAPDKGRIWLKNTDPVTLWFTNEAGTDVQLGTGGTGGLINIIEDITPELGGNLGCLDKEVGRAILVDYGIKANDVVSVSGVLTLDLSTGNVFECELFEDITSIVVSNPSPTGNYCEFDIVFTQDGTGGWDVTGWPAGMKWSAGGTEPTITVTATTGEDEVHASTRNAGTKWLGSILQDFS